MSNKKSGIKEGLLAIFLGNKNYINLEMMREAKKTVYTGYLNDDSNDLVFIIPVDHQNEVYYDVTHQSFVLANEIQMDRLNKLDLNKQTSNVLKYMNLYFSQYDFINDIERKYVEYLQKVKEILKHVVVFQTHSNVVFEDVNQRYCDLIADDEQRNMYIDDYLQKTKYILSYRHKLVGFNEQQEIGTMLYGYRTDPDSLYVYLLNHNTMCFPVASYEQMKENPFPEYYALKDTIKPLSQLGLKSVVDVDYFYEQLMNFYTAKVDIYQSSKENQETLKRLTKKRKGN